MNTTFLRSLPVAAFFCLYPGVAARAQFDGDEDRDLPEFQEKVAEIMEKMRKRGPDDDQYKGLEGPETVDSLWTEYLDAVARRNPIYMFRCYEDRITEQIEKGQPPLMDHMNHMFSLLVRDYTFKVVRESKEGDSKVIRTLHFSPKKKGEEVTTDVVFENNGKGWHLSKCPSPPPLLEFSNKTIASLVAIGLAIAVVVVIAKKLLA
jgi:hypothetical protein